MIIVGEEGSFWHAEVLLAEVSIVEPYTFKIGLLVAESTVPFSLSFFVLFLFFYYDFSILLYDLIIIALCHEQYSLYLQFTEREFELRTRTGYEN